MEKIVAKFDHDHISTDYFFKSEVHWFVEKFFK